MLRAVSTRLKELGRLAEDYGLTSSFKRVLTALNIA